MAESFIPVPRTTPVLPGSVRPAAITATASWIPPTSIDNDELIHRFDLPVTDDWIVQRTGIRTRHWLEDGKTTSDMAVAAANHALAERGATAADVDRIVLATISPDMPSPSTASAVAHKLGARCPAFDVSAACAGFLYALDIGRSAVVSGDELVLVLAAETRSRWLDTSDHRSVILFADGAGAALVEPTGSGSYGPEILSTAVGADGCAEMGAWVPAGGASRPTSMETISERLHCIQLDGKEEIFGNFLRLTRECCGTALIRAGLTMGDVDVVVPHQGNARLLERIADDLGMDRSKIVNHIDRYGNTSGASVPLALDEARRSGRIGAGDVVLLTAVGAGYVFGAAVVRF